MKAQTSPHCSIEALDAQTLRMPSGTVADRLLCSNGWDQHTHQIRSSRSYHPSTYVGHDVLQEALLKLAERIAATYTGFNPDSAKACETICRTGAAFALSNPPTNLDFFSVWPCAARHVQMAAWLLGSYCIASHTAALQMHIPCPHGCPYVCALHLA